MKKKKTKKQNIRGIYNQWDHSVFSQSQICVFFSSDSVYFFFLHILTCTNNGKKMKSLTIKFECVFFLVGFFILVACVLLISIDVNQIRHFISFLSSSSFSCSFFVSLLSFLIWTMMNAMHSTMTLWSFSFNHSEWNRNC